MTSPLLMRAILSLDAYNRGYNSGFSDGVGNPFDGLGEVGTIGGATIISREALGITEAKYAEWQAAGFYAVAYQVGGQTIISYRGTDNPGALPNGAGVVGLPGAPA